jgi:hypothetical protein
MDDIEKIVNEIELELDTATRAYINQTQSEVTLPYEDEILDDIKIEDYYSNQPIGERFLGEI